MTSYATPTNVADLAAWRKLVAGVLRKSGKLAAGDERTDPESLIATRSHEGITIKGLYLPEDAPEPTTAHGLTLAAACARSRPSAWDVRTLHAGQDVAAAQRAVLKDLENGASSVWLRVGPGHLPLGAIDAVLGEVYLDLAPVAIDGGVQAVAAAEEFLAVCKARKNYPETIRGDLGCDPYGLQARTGIAPDLAPTTALAARVAREYEFGFLRTMLVDVQVFHDAGGTDAQELGMSLAVGVAYLRAMVAEGMGVEAAAKQLTFRYAVGAEQFSGIAKLRAARVLWARVCEVAGARGWACLQVQHAVTSSAMMTQRDPWTNMLRGTVAAFAAGTGGADSITVLPFDSAIGHSDDFARRIARGTQALLLEESNLGRVADPAGGSWYVESLTRELAAAAWKVLQDIERAGGWAQAWSSGLPQASLAESCSVRAKDVARRKAAVTGVSEFPNLMEAPVVRPVVAAPAATGAESLPVHRYAEAFEILRDRADAHLARTGARPRILLATLGAVSSHTARVTYVANLLSAGGIEPVLSGPLHTESDLQVACGMHAGALPLVCLCGTDTAYTEHAAWALPALRAAGAGHVLLAGKMSALDGTGAAVDGTVAAGCDAVAVLNDLLKRLEVA